MKKIFLLLFASSLLVGCGNYSKEDLLFFSAIPQLRDVSLEPPGVEDDALEGGNPGETEQALDICTDNTLRCQAQNIATGLNELTFGLLAIIDGIIEYPPSRRSAGQRVWGPIYIGERENITIRFSMSRVDGETENPRYAHCLHIGIGKIESGAVNDIGCEVDRHESGMLRVLYGEFVPGIRADERARSGAGQLVLEAMHLKELDPGQDLDGILDIVYDNFGGTQAISIDIEAPDQGNGTIPATAQYGYALFENGAGEFGFAVKADVNGDPFSDKELFVIESRWNETLAGRATATVSGGDVPADFVWEVDECWNERLQTVYYRDPEPNNPDVGDDDGVCVLSSF